MAMATRGESRPLDARALRRLRISGVDVCDEEGRCLACQSLDFDVWKRAAEKRCRAVTARRLIYLNPRCVLCQFFSEWYRRDARFRQQDDGIRLCDVRIVGFRHHAGLYPSHGQAFLRLALFDNSSRSHCFFGRQVILGAPDHGQSPTKLAARSLRRDRVDYDILKNWVSCCQVAHGERCDSVPDALPLGLNVIDCPARRVVPFRTIGSQKSFVTLSYVWGRSQDDDLPASGKLPNSVPRVIEDAMEVTQRLGFQYLWVDRFCIPQDQREEKHSQIRNMGNIFAASALTIICAAGDGPHHGLTGISAARETEQLRVQIGGHTLIHQYANPNNLVQDSKWSTRGWTYQEGLLARRRLVFTSEQVYFQCQSIYCLESLAFVPGPDDLEREHRAGDNSWVFPPTSSRNRPPDLLLRIREYFNRTLTFDSDALDAFGGIFKLYRDMSNPVLTLCGLPIFSASTFNKYLDALDSLQLNTMRLVSALCWYSASPIRRRPCFPSWTWAGWSHSPGREDSINFDLLNICYRDEFFTDPRTFVEFPVQVVAELGHGNKLNWDSECDRLLELSHNDIHPRYLRILGWTFPLTFVLEDKNAKPCPDFPFLKPKWLEWLGKLIDEQAPGPSRRLLGGSETVEYRLTVLVLFHSRVAGTTGFLFLVPGGDPLTFERLTYCTITPDQQSHVPSLLPPEQGDEDWTPPFHMEHQELCIA